MSTLQQQRGQKRGRFYDEAEDRDMHRAICERTVMLRARHEQTMCFGSEVQRKKHLEELASATYDEARLRENKWMKEQVALLSKKREEWRKQDNEESFNKYEARVKKYQEEMPEEIRCQAYDMAKEMFEKEMAGIKDKSYREVCSEMYEVKGDCEALRSQLLLDGMRHRAELKKYNKLKRAAGQDIDPDGEYTALIRVKESEQKIWAENEDNKFEIESLKKRLREQTEANDSMIEHSRQMAEEKQEAVKEVEKVRKLYNDQKKKLQVEMVKNEKQEEELTQYKAQFGELPVNQEALRQQETDRATKRNTQTNSGHAAPPTESSATTPTEHNYGYDHKKTATVAEQLLQYKGLYSDPRVELSLDFTDFNGSINDLIALLTTCHRELNHSRKNYRSLVEIVQEMGVTGFEKLFKRTDDLQKQVSDFQKAFADAVKKEKKLEEDKQLLFEEVQWLEKILTKEQWEEWEEFLRRQERKVALKNGILLRRRVSALMTSAQLRELREFKKRQGKDSRAAHRGGARVTI
ncbi:hypothetical protein LTS18_004301 [Coniosporium uncinatum]|uniref:Uncharacterized protein n=1 Tax=Coniosporium uncinatum TaxID=93489 RepID=A0ACC3E036_9PEZI|nr:hypothetical protein LTS18_004301 [Coniosporium uncinatum]